MYSVARRSVVEPRRQKTKANFSTSPSSTLRDRKRCILPFYPLDCFTEENSKTISLKTNLTFVLNPE
ncbi:hypothetical protein NPIL_465181 [Nephila pilipes]|uniref:Uncharacterized protein n=1 Tax=Nephila pilipes TaxID=299642 RepID=A0A8X6N313_NEPPI|nr:hypothetical protein NPIL_465181 [Nephila pilipes]